MDIYVYLTENQPVQYPRKADARHCEQPLDDPSLPQAPRVLWRIELEQLGVRAGPTIHLTHLTLTQLTLTSMIVGPAVVRRRGLGGRGVELRGPNRERAVQRVDVARPRVRAEHVVVPARLVARRAPREPAPEVSSRALVVVAPAADAPVALREPLARGGHAKGAQDGLHYRPGLQGSIFIHVLVVRRALEPLLHRAEAAHPCGAGDPEAIDHEAADVAVVDRATEVRLERAEHGARVVRGDRAEGLRDEEAVPDGVQVCRGSQYCMWRL